MATHDPSRTTRPLSSTPIVLAMVGCLGAASMGCAGANGSRGGAEAVSSARDGLACVETALRNGPDAEALEDAEAHFRARCEQGHEPGSCSVLGLMHELGRGAPQDSKRAAALYEGACHAGHARACLNLGLLYASDDASGGRWRESAFLFDLACQGHEHEGCRQIALGYVQVRGIDGSAERGARLLDSSCREGHAPSCVDLGELYERGRGVAQDLTRAVQLYERACAGGNTTGCVRLDQVLMPQAEPTVEPAAPSLVAELGGQVVADGASSKVAVR